MTALDNFRVVLNPDLQTQGTWQVVLEECNVANLDGYKGSIQSAMTSNDLIRLRNPNGWPDKAALRAIGEATWNSLMTPKLEAAFDACNAVAKQKNRGMRLVVSLTGEESALTGAACVKMQQLPFEALYRGTYFLATNPTTPVSRGLRFKPDRDPLRTPYPLRILAVVPMPNDLPPGTVQDEKNAIQSALKDLIAVGSMELDFCEPPTPEKLCDRLQNKQYHILHFIAHGGFRIYPPDPSPRACLLLEQSDLDHSSAALDADALDIALQSNSIGLVVMTACSSAIPAPVNNLDGYPLHAFDGIAQHLVSSDSSVSAAVAMQFDLEAKAAPIFSKFFYTNLLRPNTAVDEVVGICRKTLASSMNPGHHAWVNPVLYWRCKDGKVFDIQPFIVVLDDATREKLKGIEDQIKNFSDLIASAQSLNTDLLASELFIQLFRDQINKLEDKRGNLLGETLRLYGGRADANRQIECRLTLRLRAPATIANINLDVCYLENKVTFIKACPANQFPDLFPAVVGNPVGGKVKLIIPNASKGTEWNPGDYELGLLSFQVVAGVKDPAIELHIENGVVDKDGKATPFEALNAMVFP